MNWHNVACFLGAWTVASLPIGILVGRMMSAAGDIDEARRSGALTAGLLSPPTLVLPVRTMRGSLEAVASLRSSRPF